MDNEKPLLTESSQMSVNDARKIIWLRGNPRPMGELLDEGYLTEARLRWASEKAFSSDLKLAAKVLLQSLGKSKNVSDTYPISFSSSSFPIQTSLEQARNTLWPFHPYKGQLMGNLLDTKQLTLKDLGYAIENAWDENVRQAAITLNLAQLKQTLETPAPAAGFLHVCESKERSFSERRQLVLSFIQGCLAGATLSAAIAVFIHIFTQRSPVQAVSRILAISSDWGVLILTITVLVGLGSGKLLSFFLDGIMNRLETQINNYRLGQQGENNVVDRMRHLLDGNWHLFRNVVLPGRNKSDIDAILIGPQGLWALEIKTFNGEYRVIGDQWQQKKDQLWKPIKSNPSQQAINNAKRLSDFIRNSNVKVWVTPVVVWACPGNPLIVQNSTMTVWQLDQLTDEIGNLCGNQKLSDADKKVIVEKLSELCDNQNHLS